MECYIGSKIIRAEPEIRDGREGYKVIYPDGYASWSPKETFEEAYRPVSRHERELINATDAEAQVSGISDGAGSHFGTCKHSFNWNLDLGQAECIKCGYVRQDTPKGA